MAFSTNTVIMGKQGRMSVTPQTDTTQIAPVMTAPTLAAGGCLHFSEASFELARQFMTVDTNRQGLQPDLRQIVPGAKSTDFTIKTMILPPVGLAGSAIPETHHMLRAFFNGFVYNANVSIAYTLGNQSVPKLFSIAMTHNFQEQIQGAFMWNAFLKSLKISVSGGQAPTFEFAGASADIGLATKAEVVSVIDGDTFGIQSVDAYRLTPGAYVSLNGGAQASGLGWKVSTVVFNGGTVNVIGDVITGLISAGQFIRPHLQEPADWPNNPFGPIGHSLTIDGITMPLRSAEVTIDNGLAVFDDDAGSDGPSGATHGTRNIDCSFTIRADDEIVGMLQQQQAVQSSGNIKTRNVILTLRGGLATPDAGRTCTINLPSFVADYKYTSPGTDGPAEVTFAGKAYDTTAGQNNAISMVWT